VSTESKYIPHDLTPVESKIDFIEVETGIMVARGCGEHKKGMLGVVVHTCNPSYSGGEDKEDHCLRPA
jgi:hypothetical protein